jgi:hypothetical protein
LTIAAFIVHDENAWWTFDEQRDRAHVRPNWAFT